MPSPDTVRSLEDLLAAASSRQPWVPDDTKSGARFERVGPGVVADALTLPFRDSAFDAALAGFLLNRR